MDVVTLDGLGQIPDDAPEGVEFINSVTNYSNSGVSHFSVLKNLAVASDISGAGSFDGVTPEARNGAALGVTGTSDVTGWGMYTDRNGNTILVAQEDKKPWSIIKENGLLGDSWYQFELERKFGEGGAFEANALMIAGITQERYRNYEVWARNDQHPNPIPGLTVRHWNQVVPLLQELEDTGRRFDRPIAVILTGSPVTFASIVGEFFDIVVSIARQFATGLGLPPKLFDVIVPLLKSLATGNKISSEELGQAALFIGNEIVRGEGNNYLNQAMRVYNAASLGQYAQAAEYAGVSSQDFRSLMGADYSVLLDSDVTKFLPVARTFQNVENMDTVNGLRARMKTGGLYDEIIESGTIARVPVLQNALISSQSGGLLGMLPGTLELSSVVANETNDIADAQTHKAFVMSAMGYVPFTDALDALALRSLAERAIEQARKGARSFVMPQGLSWHKRGKFAAEVSAMTGVEVVAGIPEEETEIINSLQDDVSGANVVLVTGATALAIGAGIYFFTR